jgi:hypothetical protein
MTTRALSIAPYAADALAGRERPGIGLGHGYILVGDQVLALTPPGKPRMPNGIETDLVVAEGEAVTAGGGSLRTATATVEGGPLWNPRPSPRVTLSLRPQPQLRLDRLAGRGPGLTPLGDDIVIGYLAAAALNGTPRADVHALVTHTARRTTRLSATLLYLAAGGALPEAAHPLLLDGDPEPLLRFGATSGRGIAFGLALCGIRNGAASSNETCVTIGGFELVIGTRTAPSTPLELAHV